MTPNQTPGLESPHRFAAPASEAALSRIAAALEGNGIDVVRAATVAEAKNAVLDLIPEGSQVHTASSQSLEVSGILDEIEGSGRYEAVRAQLWSMSRETQADEIRRLGAAPDVMVGSVHAVTEDGSLVAASATGGQLGPYVHGAGRVVLLVGAQKIVSDLDEALQRIDDHILPLESVRTQAAYGVDSSVNAVLIIHRAWPPGRITVVLVDESLGF